MQWWLRIVVLGTGLRLADDPACGEFAAEMARSAIRDHLLNFPEDPVAREAHRLELSLAPLIVRTTATPTLIDLNAQVADLRRQLPTEQRIRLNPTPAWLYSLHVTTTMRRLFITMEPWNAEYLGEQADNAERLLQGFDYSAAARDYGPAGDPFLERWSRVDPLVECTVIVLAGAPAAAGLLTEPIIQRLEQLAADNDRIYSPSATRVLECVHDSGAAG
jgi:hypothetical protein